MVTASPLALAPPATVLAGRRERLHALDGLRGLAALIVVFHHALLCSRDFADAQAHLPFSGTMAHLLAHSPLRVLWGGNEAVVIFFVLSGTVLALPAVRGTVVDLNEYFTRRLVRLYFPVWGALAFAVALRVLVPHRVVEGGSSWLNQHAVPLKVAVVLREALLVFGAGAFATNSVFWSLTWEVLFSLLLPFFTATMLVLRRHTLLLVPCLMVMSAGAELVHGVPEALKFFPMFAIGIALAIELPQLQVARRTVAARSRLLWPAIGVFALLALTARASVAPLLQDLTPEATRLAAAVGLFMTTLGATLIVTLTITWDGWRAQMERPTWQWLGRYSYSLYLVHEPIVVSLAFVLSVTQNPLLVLLLGVPLSLLAAVALYHAVELPSMKLASRVGRRSAELGRVAG